MTKHRLNEKNLYSRFVNCCKDAKVKKFRQTDRHFGERNYHHNTIYDVVDYANEISELLSNCRSSRCDENLKMKNQEKLNVKKQQQQKRKKEILSVKRTTVPITPQMIRFAIKELETRRAYISSSLIAKHLRRSYPIENNPDALKEELNDKLNCAVSVGLIAKCGDDKYCIPTLRQRANFNKTAVTAFWDTYYGSSAPSSMGQFITLGMLKTKADRRKTDIRSTHSSDKSNDF